MNERQLGRIITFYSYKGGTGRTMALANIACLLARRLAVESKSKPGNPRVVAIDWDFEAPGLHRFFRPYLTAAAAKAFDNAPGCLDVFIKLNESRSEYDPKDFAGNRQRACESLATIGFEDFLLESTVPSLAVVKSGRFDDDYAKRVSQFAWDDFFHATVGFFLGFADFLRERFD